MKIFAKTSDGKIFQIDVKKTNRIIDIKEKIQEKTGLSLHKQELWYQGGILEDDKIIEKYHIYENCTINMVARLRLYVKKIDGSSRTFIMDVAETDRIIVIKKNMQKKTGIPTDRQVLVFQSVILEDDKTFVEYQILDDDVILSVTPFRKEIQIFVKTKDGNLALNVAMTDKIIDIKNMLEEKMGLHPDEQILKYNSMRMVDDKCISIYKLEDNSVIDIIIILRSKVLLVTLPDNKTAVFEPMLMEKIRDLKESIKLKTSLNMAQRGLKFGNKILNDDDFIGHCGFLEKSRLCVTP